MATQGDHPTALRPGYWDSISVGVEWIAKFAGALSAIRFAQHMIGQSPAYFLASLMHAYSEIFYPPVDWTFGNIARAFGVDLPDAAKDLIIFYLIFAGIFYRALMGSSLGVRQTWEVRKGAFGFGLLWPARVIALPAMWVFAQAFPEDAEAFDWVTGGLLRETFIVVAIILVSCLGTAAGFL